MLKAHRSEFYARGRFRNNFERGMKMKTNRLTILENSLEKKEAEFARRLDEHWEDVKSTNGQPLNDKRNGQATLDRWDRQRQALTKKEESIEKTKRAIEREKYKITNVESLVLPPEIKELVDNGTLSQWRKYPNRFFVNGVERGRIVFDTKTQNIYPAYHTEIPNQEQYTIYKTVFMDLQKKLVKKIKAAQQCKSR
nr:MAG TPA: hypothetical protein [Caudoviricetes sp.]